MKPSRIRVFDGLRITTEHINHVQTAFASGIEDLRQIAGLGRIHSGLAVTFEGGQAIVAPGLAFDPLGNRLGFDQAQSVGVDFAAGERLKYVCAKYESVEDGQVEGQATLLFDSSSILVQTDPPKPEDNLVVLAKIVNSPDGIKVEPSSQSSGQPFTQGPGGAVSGQTLRVAQGATKIKGELLQISASTESNMLLEQDLELSYLPASLTAWVLVSATISILPPPPASQDVPPAPLQTDFKFDCRADSECSLTDSGIRQYSISTTSTPDFSDREMARLFLDLPSSSGLDSLKSAYVAIRLARNNAGQLKIVSTLDWFAVPSDEAVKSIQNLKPSLSWQALFVWRALGEFAV
jgi:hypothetical protein